MKTLSLRSLSQRRYSPVVPLHNDCVHFQIDIDGRLVAVPYILRPEEKCFLVPGKWNVLAHLEGLPVLRVDEKEKYRQYSHCGMFQMLQIPFKTLTRQKTWESARLAAPRNSPPALTKTSSGPSVCPSQLILQSTSCGKVKLYSQNTGVIACLRYEASVPH